jgi:hypothetical protein
VALAGRKDSSRNFLISVKVEFTLLTPSLVPGCRAFNDRLRAQGKPPFLLPEDALENEGAATRGDVCRNHYVAVDESGAVRGGVLLMEQRGWLGKAAIPLVNIQSPLSEGIVDRRFSGVSLQMLKFVHRRSPYAYAVGMGNAENSFPRLLRAAGWSVSPVPFAFAVIDPRRFLKEIGPLRSGKLRWLARGIAASGLGSALLEAWHLAHRDPTAQRYSLEPATSWPEGTDAVWERCRDEVSFSVLRDESTLAALYPSREPRLKRFLLRYAGEVVGWSVTVATKMDRNPNFGDMLVGTILDGLSTKAHMAVLLALTRKALCEMGAEVVLTNQTHCLWQAESRRLGFVSGRSNYLLAMSKDLAAALASEPGALRRIHVNRGDGDGRIHL